MSKQIKIIIKNIEIEAILNDSFTASKIWDILPIETKINTWGKEIYFTIPVITKAENPKSLVEKGDIGYWIQGTALCIFFGPTPNSRGNEIRPASPVNIVGKILGNLEIFEKLQDGDIIKIIK